MAGSLIAQVSSEAGREGTSDHSGESRGGTGGDMAGSLIAQVSPEAGREEEDRRRR